MRLFTFLVFALALVQQPTHTYAQPEPDPAGDEDDDGDVEDEAPPDEAPDEVPAEPEEDEDEAEAPAEAAPPDPPPEKKAEKKKAKKKKAKKKKARKKKKKAKKKAKKKSPPDVDEDAAETARKPADEAVEPPARTVLAERQLADGRPAVMQRASTVDGALGMDRIWSADPGPEGTFRLRFAYRFFEVEDWPIDGSNNSFNGTHFAFSWTPLAQLEVFLGLKSTSNDNAGSRPRLLQTQGDLSLGVKGGLFLTDVIAVGVGARLNFLSGIGSTGFELDGISPEFRVLFTADLHKKDLAPLRIHFNASYYLENGEALYADREDEPDLIQEWGLQAYRYDRMMIGLGFEVPASPYVSPFVEYNIGTPFLVELSRRGRGSVDFDFASVPHALTGGLRAFPLPELAVEAVGRFGFSDTPFTGVTATPPWEVVLGLTYTLDPRPKVIERDVAPAVPVKVVPDTVKVAGKIVDRKSGEPIAGARIAYLGDGVAVTPQITGEDGVFGGYAFEPGKIRLEIEAKGYKARTKKLTLKAGKDRKLKLKMKVDPATMNGTVEIRAFDAKGKPMGAQASLDDPAASAGEIKPAAPLLLEVKAGTYTLTTTTKGFKTIKQQLDVVGGESKSVRVAMQKGRGVLVVGGDGPRPKLVSTPPPPLRKTRAPRAAGARSGGGGGAGLAWVKGNSVRVKGKIEFDGETPKISTGSKRLLTAVAGLMKRNTKIGKLRIGVHTDGRGDADAKRALSSKQARSVKSYLVSRGVARGRLSTKGFGPDKPIAPNMSARGRAKNRRVDLSILEMAP